MIWRGFANVGTPLAPEDFAIVMGVGQSDLTPNKRNIRTFLHLMLLDLVQSMY